MNAIGKMTSTRLYTALACLATLAQPCFAEDAPRFIPLASGHAVSYVASGNKFLPLRSGTTLHPRAVTRTDAREVRPTQQPSQQQMAEAVSQATSSSGFSVKRYQPAPRAVFRLRNQSPATATAAPVQKVSIAPTPRDNNGNHELTSNAPYSSSFYGSSHIGLTEHTWPVELSAQQRISSGFGMRSHPVTGRDAFHKGVDIAAPSGSAVLASADGVVEETGQDGLIGKYVRLRHPDGSQSLYGHLSSLNVKEADWLKRHQQLGAVGTTGRTTGPHLHFALNVDGQAMDPMPYLAKTGREVASR